MIEKILEIAEKNAEGIVGGYKYVNGIFQFDASIVEPNDQIAISLMVVHDQDCIYNLKTHKMIWKMF